MDRIAVWNTAFLGDAVLTLPLLQSLHAAYPRAQIDFYVREGLASLFQCHPALNRVIALSRKQRALRQLSFLSRQLQHENYDLWTCAHTSLRSAFIARLSCAKQRIGYKEVPFHKLWFSSSVSRCFTEKEEIERLLELLQPLDVEISSHHPELFLPDDAMLSAKDFFSRLEGPVLGIHPGSVWQTKRWPAKYFSEIGRRSVKLGAEVLLFAGKGEEQIAKETYHYLLEGVGKEESARVHNLSGRLSLVELAAYIGKLSSYLTNDSGPMHLAWAQRVPVTAIFGPTDASLGFFPRGPLSHVMELDLSCRPCGLHGHASCPQKHHNCVNLLLPDAVWPDVSSKLFGSAVL